MLEFQDYCCGGSNASLRSLATIGVVECCDQN
jgi:hypothetical protein